MSKKDVKERTSIRISKELKDFARKENINISRTTEQALRMLKEFKDNEKP